MEILSHLTNMEVGYLGAIAAFLIQFAGIIWRISRAETNIHSRITSVENTDSLKREQIKQDLLQLRLDIENEFLKKDSFRLVTANIDAHLVRLEAKLDAVIGFKGSK